MKSNIIDIKKLSKYKQYFSDSDFWKKITSVAKKLGKVPAYYALVLYYVLESPDVSIQTKGIIIGTLGYLIFPFDIISDFIPVLGLLDDATALKLAYDAVKNSVTPEIEAQAMATIDKWFHE